MKRKVSIWLVAVFTLLSGTAFAVQPVLVYEWQVEQGKAGAFAAALDDLQNSAVGKDRSAQVQLQATTFNGVNPATHRVVVLYPSLTEMDQWNAKFLGSKTQETFTTAISEIATPVAQSMTVPMQSWGTVSSKDTHWDSISILAANPVGTLASLDELMNAPEMADFPGQIWLVQVLRGQASPGGHMTHQIYIGYENLSELDAWSDKMYQTEAWQKYIAAASQNFTVVNRETVVWLRAYEHSYSLEEFE
ncbi:MAG: hypothetical protein GWP70_09915 [Proteobacteria bacterium]|nr:hypothetical protein [Pseudomonadota bacterium]